MAIADDRRRRQQEQHRRRARQHKRDKHSVDSGDRQSVLDRRKDNRGYFYLFNMVFVSLILAGRV